MLILLDLGSWCCVAAGVMMVPRSQIVPEDSESAGWFTVSEVSIPVRQLRFMSTWSVVKRYTMRGEIPKCGHSLSNVQHRRFRELEPSGTGVFHCVVHLRERNDQPIDDCEEEKSIVPTSPNQCCNETRGNEAANSLRIGTIQFSKNLEDSNRTKLMMARVQLTPLRS